MRSEDQPLAGGWNTTVRRHGDTVVRARKPSSPAVVDLLHHLDRVGYPYAPRPIGTGFTDEGDEILSHIPGESPQPMPWSDDAVHQVGVMLRGLHDALVDFTPALDGEWLDWWGRELGDPTAGFGHGDLGPWNVMAVDGVPTGFIDWDTAGPLDPEWEIAQAAWLNAQLHDDDLAERIGLGDVEHRSAQLAAFLDGYRYEPVRRRDLVDRMVAFAVHSARADAVEYGVTAETTAGTGPDGFPFLWGITWRVRSASWMLRNRSALERAIGV